jgi:DNA (cytosine-5)-methyltransferase 1
VEKIKIASLFSGCGGTDVGAVGDFNFLGKKYAGHNTEVVYANDIELKACDIFDENFHIKSDRRDIKTIPESDIPEHDLLLAGFPCQSFSILAQNPPRLGFKDEKGKLFFEIVRMLKYHTPKYFICENVKGLISANKGKTLPLILKEFEACGYRVSYKLLNSKNFGVPQKRERIFIVGVRADINEEYKFPDIELDDIELEPLRGVLEENVSDKYQFSEKAVQGMLNSNRKSKVKMNKGRAQDLDKPCNTVTAHLAKVTLNGTDPVLKNEAGYRRFTPREVARIQSFPESFRLVGSETAQYKALGNAIPPVMFWHVIKELLLLDEKCKNIGTMPKNPNLKSISEQQMTFGM